MSLSREDQASLPVILVLFFCLSISSHCYIILVVLYYFINIFITLEEGIFLFFYLPLNPLKEQTRTCSLIKNFCMMVYETSAGCTSGGVAAICDITRC